MSIKLQGYSIQVKNSHVELKNNRERLEKIKPP